MDLEKLQRMKTDLSQKEDSEVGMSDSEKREQMEGLLKKYEEAKIAHGERQEVADWSTAASSVASTLDKYSARPVGLEAQQFSAGKGPELNDISKEASLKDLGIEKKDPLMDLRRRKLMADIDKTGRTNAGDPLLDSKRRKLEAEINKLNRTKDGDPLADLKKQKLEAQISKLKSKGSAKLTEFDKTLDKKQAAEFAKTSTQAKTSGMNDSLLDDTMKSFLDYSRSSKAGGTGPIASGFGIKKYLDEDTEKLDAKFKTVGFDKLTKMFAGMSKAIDSDAERAAFEATQPSIKNDDLTNASIILGAQAVNLRNKAEARAQADWIKGNDNLREYVSPVMEKPTSVLVSPEGKLELVDREQTEEMKSNGYITLDERAKSLVNDNGGQYSPTKEAGITKFMEKNNLSRDAAIKVLVKAGRL